MTTENSPQKGYERERNLEKSAYYSREYFQLGQLCSFAHQIHDIYELKPKNILEVGIGNGFTSSFLKRAGFDVVTVDINPNLEPDICASILELELLIKESSFDLIVCCEVLEHMPFKDFSKSIEIFHSIGQRLYMTLPNHKKTFGFGGFLRLPKMSPLPVDAQIDFSRPWPLGKSHYWEVDYSSETSKNSILEKMRKMYSRVNVRKLFLSPHHLAFYADK